MKAIPQTAPKNASKIAAGRKGGQTTASRHGSEHMRTIGYCGAMSKCERHYAGDVRAMMDDLSAKIANPAVWDDKLMCYRRAPLN